MFDSISTGKYWDKPWSLVSGCTRCSPGCDHCWAMAMEKRFGRKEKSMRVMGNKWEFTPNIITHPERLDVPMKRKKPTVWAIWNDIGHDDVPYPFLHAAFRIMLSERRHIFLVLTKRPKRLLYFLLEGGVSGWQTPPKNVWIGTTVCNQAEADEKIPILLQIPAAVRWVSVEPILSAIDLSRYLGGRNDKTGRVVLSANGDGDFLDRRIRSDMEAQEVCRNGQDQKEDYPNRHSETSGGNSEVTQPSSSADVRGSKEDCRLCSSRGMDSLQQKRDSVRDGHQSPEREATGQQPRELRDRDEAGKYHPCGARPSCYGKENAERRGEYFGKTNGGEGLPNAGSVRSRTLETKNDCRMVRGLSIHDKRYSPKTDMDSSGLDWVVLGGETGPGARPMNSDWALSIKNQCVSAGVPLFFKSWGSARGNNVGRVLDGRTWNELPERS